MPLVGCGYQGRSVANTLLNGCHNPYFSRKKMSSQAQPLTLGTWKPQMSAPSSLTTSLDPPKGAAPHSLSVSLMTADSSGRRLRSEAVKPRPGVVPALRPAAAAERAGRAEAGEVGG